MPTNPTLTPVSNIIPSATLCPSLSYKGTIEKIVYQLRQMESPGGVLLAQRET